MGAYSPLPDLPDDAADEIVEQFHRPILAELARRGTPFRGALYAGLMLTADGPVLLECNARFGDPETQVILPRLAVPLGPLLLAAAKGKLRAAARPLGIEGNRLPALPGASRRHRARVGRLSRRATGRRRDRGPRAARATGATRLPRRDAARRRRRLSDRRWARPDVVGRGVDLAAAREQAESAAERISFDGLQRRRDIGLEAERRSPG